MPSDIIRERVCAEAEDGVVVFLIGMRINRWWKVWRWLPIAAAMPRMLRELAAHPERGLLSVRGHFGIRNHMVLQYWRSVADLHAYAHDAGAEHRPAWRAFNSRIGTSGDVGIWHETYAVPPGQLESMYVNMPPYGLGLAGRLAPATGSRATAAKRMAMQPSATSSPA